MEKRNYCDRDHRGRRRPLDRRGYVPDFRRADQLDPCRERRAFGSFIVPKIRGENGGGIVGFSGIFMGTLVFSFGLIPPEGSFIVKYSALCGLMFLLGVCGGMINVVIGSSFLKIVPKEMMGRLSGLMTASMMASMPVSSFICSAMALRISIPMIFSIFGIGLVLCYSWMFFRGKFKAI